MSTASILPATSRARRRLSIRRFAALLTASASSRKAGPWLVIGFAILHAMLWTMILIQLKAAQDIHFDVAEGYAWGQKFQLGYGKHPSIVPSELICKRIMNVNQSGSLVFKLH